MTKVAVAGFQHETNTFLKDTTNISDFVKPAAWPGLTEGQEIFTKFEGLNIPISGFLETWPGEISPILWAMAEPGGYVCDDAFDNISQKIVSRLSDIRPGAVYLDLHGAMVTERFDDAEAELLKRIRSALGSDVPIVVSLDLHANISRELFDLATAMSIYRTYPHVDFAETGRRAAQLLSVALEKKLYKSFHQLDFVIPITAQSTLHEPGKSIYERISDFKLASVDMALGFPAADIPDTGVALVSYGEDQSAVESSIQELKQHVLQSIDVFDARLTDAKSAVRIAVNSSKTVILADPQDNPGAGGTSDTTGILKALLEANAPDAVLAMLYDPEATRAAHDAGIGAVLRLKLGGKYHEYSTPVEADVVVQALSDGDFVCSGPMFHGSQAHLGPMAALKINGTGIIVVVGVTRCQNLDQEFFRTVGIEPADHKIVCVKSAIHFIADYGRISDHILFAVSPGANPCDLKQLHYSKLRTGVTLLN